MDLILKNINVKLGDKNIIQDISLAVAKGEFVGIIGPNGSGKSTLLRTIYRIIKPTSGTILLDGQNIKHVKLSESAKKMGVVGQFNTINFDFTVFDMVMMGRTPHKSLLGSDQPDDYEIAMESIRKVGMEKNTHRSFSTLSGGEKQRIILARALAQQPQLLILDEPTNHLDIKYQLQILSIVKSLGIGVLAALHDLSLAAMYCTKLYVLKDGHVITSGIPNQILTPELVRDVYEIECDIHENPDTGYLAINYYPTSLHA
ncbi:ABC transporter ATP-binding protein [Pelosinus sp. sgz500959]|uniref:ABC transporter ATP-binding protein n=1 Tax=Pelosinus sp. sgz500959 TaxID=3242472 RepID=UPI00366B2B1B